MTTKKELNEMFDNLLHIGNKTNFWSPRMRDYIYGSVNGIHVINLVKTSEKLEEMKKELVSLASQGKKILFVATKLQARDAYEDLAKETGHSYVCEKWVPGLLTNFRTIKRRISTYLKLLRDSETGAMDILTKKEKAAKMLELEKLDKAFKGLKEMKKIPDAIFVVDGVYDAQAVKEANSLNIPVYAVYNTNGDENLVANLIPANTNSVKSHEYLAGELKSVLAGVKVSAPKKSNVRKIQPKMISGAKKTPVKKSSDSAKAASGKPVKKDEVNPT